MQDDVNGSGSSMEKEGKGPWIHHEGGNREDIMINVIYIYIISVECWTEKKLFTYNVITNRGGYVLLHRELRYDT